MATYSVTFNRIGKNDKIGTVVMEDVENPAQLRNRIRKFVEREHIVMDSSRIGVQLMGESVWIGHEGMRIGSATVAETPDDGPLSADRPCDWVLPHSEGGGTCGKPSANVRWGISSMQRWHCPEHVPQGEKFNWKRSEKPKVKVKQSQTYHIETGVSVYGATITSSTSTR